MIRLFPLLFCFFTLSLSAQQFPMDSSPLLNTCSGFFTDSGGNNADYGNNENLFSTICADRTEGTHIKLTFSHIDLSFGDELCFFDGLDNTAPMLACASDFFNGFPFIVQATAANSSGCLTISFDSDGSNTGQGWDANIDCVPSCQLIQAELTSTNPAPIIVDTGWIDICQGDRVSFSGQGLFPQNGLVYEHSENTSSFEWDFGDGIIAVGKNVSHVYQEPGGYKASLTITDQFGCTNSNFVVQRVRVSTKPSFEIGDLPDEICAGDTLRLNASSANDNVNSTVEIGTQAGAFLFNGIRSDSLPLPDGNGTSYETSIRFSDFAPGQVLNDINDLQSICVNMEHSWLHDMEISITCPSGNSVLLQRQEVINEEVYLGIPNDNDGINPSAGVGLEYCWTPISVNGTITEFANKNDNSSSSEPYYLPNGDFNSFEDLENLLGCPLNGEWTITVTDLWEQDNGWIFSWGIDINPDLYPTLETFEPQIVDFQWQNNTDIIDYSKEEIIVRPQNAGTANFVFEATDDFGCRHDTTVQFSVLPPNHPDCINCEETLFEQTEITICENDIINLEQFIDPVALGVVTFEAFPNYEFSFTNHPTVNPYESSLQVSNIPNPKIADDASNLISVCLNIESEFNADLSLILVSPNGINLNLSIENGGSSDGYQNTCFIAKADTSIVNGTGPYAGDYQPEEPFTKLAGTDINGVWKLRVSDDAGTAATDVNILKSWSMTFSSPSDANWTWRPSTGLSCTNCTNPMAQPTESIAYILEKNLDGCQVFDTLNVTVFPSGAPEPLIDYSLPDGDVLVNWIAVPGADAYEISFDGLDWEPPNGDFFHIVSGLSNGESFNIFVRALFNELGCVTTPRSKAIRYVVCDLENDLINSILTTSCDTFADGEIVINTTGGIAPYTYTFTDSLTSLTTMANRFTGLAPGDYSVLIQDSTQTCADTLSFSIVAPSPIQLNFEVNELNCSEDTNGTVLVLPSGGVGNYRVIQWSDNISSDFEAENLAAGDYIVTVADGNGCEKIDTAKIIAPTPLSVLPSASLPTCFSENDGAVSVKVTGATPPYDVQWSNSQSGPSAINLGAGDFSVTITDANSCSVDTFLTLTEPPIIEFDAIEIAPSCSDTANGQIIVEVRGGVPPFDYRWSNDQTNNTAFNLAPGDYSLTVTDSRNCMAEFQTELIAAQPILITTNSVAPLCFGENNGQAEVFVEGGTAPYTYLWNDPDSQITNVITGLAPNEYEVTITDSLGCQGISIVTVNDSESIEVEVSSTPASCSYIPDGTVSVNVEGGTEEYTYLWSSGDTTSTVSGLLPGWHYLILEDSNGCQALDSVEIAAPDTLKIDSIIIKMPLCHGFVNGELEAKISGGVEPYSYNWDNGTRANPFIGVSAGTHRLLVIDANGCGISDTTIEVTQPDSLILALEKTDAACFNGNDGTASVTINGGIAPYEYLWSDTDAQKDSLAINLEAGDYTVQVNDQNGCRIQTNLTIDQPDSGLSADISQIQIGCFKDQQSSASILPMGGTGNNYKINWSHGDTTINVQNLASGDYTVTISDENDCELVESIEIIERDSIQINLATVTPACREFEDGRIAITGITGGAGNGQIDDYRIEWSTNAAANSAFITDLAGDFTYTITVTDTAGCRNVIERYLSLPDPLSFDLTKQDISCFGAADGQIAIQNGENQPAITSYEWSDNVSDTVTATATNLLVGDYSVIITNENGCSTSVSTSITEPQAIFVPIIDLSPNICTNDLSGKITIEVMGGQPNYTFLWSNGATTQNLENVASGNYELTITDDSNCQLTQTFELTNPTALAGNILSQAVSCFGENDGSLSIIATGGQPPYSYSIDGENFNGLNEIIGLSSGNYTVFLKDNNDCIWESSSLQITQPPEFTVEISTPTRTIDFGQSTELSVSFQNNNGNVQYSWEANQPNTFLCEEDLCSTIEINPTNSTIYEIYAIDDNGCEASNQLTINVAKTRKIFVPTGFSPNADGNNDVLMVHGQENAKIRAFRLFNRWGEEVFTSFDVIINDPLSGWDGTYGGDPLNTGVFAWLIEVEYADGEVEILKGSTTLIR